ncbi:STAS domain-containing protein [Actinomycetospora sp. C-140]
MDAAGQQKIVLSGVFSEFEAADLATRCAHLERERARHVIVDVTAVTSCDRAGLQCWAELHQRAGTLSVKIEGASWTQFFELLRETDVRRLPPVYDDIRELVPRRRPHQRPA